MAIKVYKPTTPGRRKSSVVDWKELTQKRPEKSLTVALKKKAGRSKGRITVRHRGGGHKRLYRKIDFRRKKYDVVAEVIAVEYDPNRSARIALIQYEDGEKAYMLAPQGLKEGMKVVSSQGPLKTESGNRMPLEFVPPGVSVYNIELIPGKGGQIVRSAGQAATVMTIEGKWAQLKLPSGEVRLFPKECTATVGVVSNPDHRLVRIGKAGRMRWLRRRPQVLGKSMNPVDHPHGGGEGHSPIGLKAPKTPWGKKALGVKTRKKGKASDKLILQRRKKKRRK